MEVYDAYVTLPPLYTADIGAVQPAIHGQFFLR